MTPWFLSPLKANDTVRRA